jgi:hypothetical protein
VGGEGTVLGGRVGVGTGVEGITRVSSEGVGDLLQASSPTTSSAPVNCAAATSHSSIVCEALTLLELPVICSLRDHTYPQHSRDYSLW